MPVPWLRLIDAALGFGDVVRRARLRSELGDETRQLAQSRSLLGGMETRLAGVVVAALKEAFDRDSQRLVLEREKQEAERERAERLLKLELLRQAGEREIARLRLIGVAALAGWLGALVVATRIVETSGRVVVGLGWILLLAALVAAFAEQARINRAIAVADDRLSVEAATAPGVGGLASPWLVAAGMVAVTIAVLL
ncbi:MAG: hypothetical protein QM736_03035 [Vicinamibacterales bacterium]